jgi:glycosyltransferase involved in cell wall biosynthesis
MKEKKLQVIMLDPANLTPYYNYALCSGLNKAGVDTTLYSTKFVADETLEAEVGIDFVDFYFKRFRTLQQGKQRILRQLLRGISYPFDHYRLLRRLRHRKADIVHWQWTRLPIIDLWLMNRLHALGIPSVITIHDVTPVYRAGSDKQRLRVLNQAEALIVHDASAKSALLMRYPELPTAKIFEIPHGPLQADKLGSAYNKGRARAMLNIAPERKVVLFFGEIKHYKGLDVLIDAFGALEGPRPELLLLVAGEPNKDCQPDFSKLSALGLEHQSDLRYLPAADVWKYFKASDLVVLPYREISQSGVLFSALAHGRAVIVSDVGGMPEVVKRLDAGWVISRESPDELADAITEALSDMHELQARGIKAQIAVEEIYGWGAIGKKTLRVYRNVCGE